jgi:quercetin dioxygenase-like cupin family protein
MDPAHFTGLTTSHPLHQVKDLHPLSVSLVRFEAGSRNVWHSHSGGQMLHVVEGEGWVQSRAEPPRRIRSGDSISAEPGEEHWHGAGREGPMAHLAISSGDITYLEPSEEPDLDGS